MQALQKAKSIQQILLIDKEILEPWLLAAVMTNYANSLDHLGRTIEAIDVYMECITFFPDHAMAIGNCGIAFKRISRLSNHHAIKNLYQSWDLLTQACNMKAKILEFSSQAAINWFEAHLNELLEEIDFRFDIGLDGLKQYARHRQEVHGYPKCSNLLTKMKRTRLLLSMNLSPLESVEECVDDLVFEKIITLGGHEGLERFSTLANSSLSIY